MTDQTPTGSLALSRQRLVDLVIFEYRSLVVRRLGVTAAEWSGPTAACANQDKATLDMCQRCPIAAECLAAASPSHRRPEPHQHLAGSATTTNPNEYESNDLAVTIRYAAHDAIRLPNVDIKAGTRRESTAPGSR